MVSYAFLRFLDLLPASPTSHDFGDGAGAVDAHQHPNGDGWVADTAEVHLSAFIDATSVVFGTTQVGPGVNVINGSVVKDNARVLDASTIDNSTIKDNAWIYGGASIKNSTIAEYIHVFDEASIEDVELPIDSEWENPFTSEEEDDIDEAIDSFYRDYLPSKYNKIGTNISVPVVLGEGFEVGHIDGDETEDDDIIDE